MKKSLILLLILFGIYSGANCQVKAGLESFRERLNLLENFEPITLLEWGNNYETVIDSIYKRREEIFVQDKDKGLIIYKMQSSAVGLYFKNQKLYKSTQELSIPSNLSPHNIYYDFFENIKAKFGDAERKMEDNKPYVKWNLRPVSILLVLQPEKEYVKLVYENHQL